MGNEELLGTGWGFPPQFYDKGNDIALVSGQEDIQESLEILFSTAITERIHHPAFGADLKKFMFEEVNYALVQKIQDMVIRAIVRYEPRVKVLRVEITESEENAYLLLISVDYLIKSMGTEHNIVFPLSIQ